MEELNVPLKFFKSTTLNPYPSAYEIFNAVGYPLGFFYEYSGVWVLERRSLALTLDQMKEIVEAMEKARDGKETEIVVMSNQEYEETRRKIQDESKPKDDR